MPAHHLRRSLPCLCLSTLWMVLGLGKASGGDAFAAGLAARLPSFLAVDPALLAAAVIVAEILLAALLLMVMPSLAGDRERVRTLRRVLARTSIAASVLTGIVVALESASLPSCGCFGALASSTRARRLVVSGVLLWLSLAVDLGEGKSQRGSPSSPRDVPMSATAGTSFPTAGASFPPANPTSPPANPTSPPASPTSPPTLPSPGPGSQPAVLGA